MGREYILVTGSKPEFDLPLNSPIQAYCANASLSRLQHLAGRCHLTAVISNYVFLRDSEGCIAARTALRGSFADRLIVFSTGRDLDSFRIANKTFDFVDREFMSNLELLRRKSMPFSLYDLMRVIILSAKGSSLRKLIRQIIYLKPAMLHLSTGVLALAIAITENPSCKRFFLAGIGLKPGKHYYAKDVNYPVAHIRADSFFLSALIKNNPAIKLETDDADLAKYLHECGR